jgi:hypothetical protein
MAAKRKIQVIVLLRSRDDAAAGDVQDSEALNV